MVDPCMLDRLDFMVKFQEDVRPQLINYKYVRKLLLTVEAGQRHLAAMAAHLGI